jgi:hypothetical protein
MHVEFIPSLAHFFLPQKQSGESQYADVGPFQMLVRRAPRERLAHALRSAWGPDAMTRESWLAQY